MMTHQDIRGLPVEGLNTIRRTPSLALHAGALLLAVGLFSACGGASDSDDASPDQTSTAPPQTTASTEPPAAPTTTTTSTTPAPADLSAEEIYSLLSPSIPLIETPVGTGSGILVDDGFVVTNYHVVWPYDRAWVVFPDGTEFADVPVVSWDPFADLAVLGPIDVPLPSLSLADGEGMSAGSEVYLIGYPAETDLYPEPSITGGVLSRAREWDAYGLTLFQSDAAIAGGQSGGALVNSMGEIVGISTWSFSEAGFGVSISAADAAEIVGPFIEDHEALLSESLHPLGGHAAFEFQVELANGWDTAVFFFEGTAGSTFEVAIEGIGDGALEVAGPHGVVLEVDESVEGIEYGAVELPVDGPYLVEVSTFWGEAQKGPFTLGSNVELIPYDDPDDGQVLSVGQTIGGVIDYHADIDWYSIDLRAGDAIVLWTEAIATDTALLIAPVSDFLEMDLDDDSGPALFGESRNALLHYTAPFSDEYLIVVSEAVGAGGGSYFLGVDYADPMVEEPVEEEPLGAPDSSVEGSDNAVPGVDRDTTWREVFDVLLPDEQQCIRQALGEDLEEALARRLLSDDLSEVDLLIFDCVNDETARALLLLLLVFEADYEQVVLEQTNIECLAEVLAEADATAVVTALAAYTDLPEDVGAVVTSLFACYPEGAFER